MKFAWRCVVAFFVMACGIALAQQSSNGSSATLAFEDGRIANNVYSNECLGFSLAIPDGWKPKPVGTDGKAAHIGKAALVLLIIGEPKEGSSESQIVLTARDAGGSVMSAEEVVSKSVQTQINGDRQRSELVRDAYAVDYGGRRLFRADYKQTINGRVLYRAFVYTRFRDFYIGESLGAESPADLELAVSSLHGISFREDKPNPKCVMRGDDSSNSGGIIGGVLSSKPGTSSDLPQRVRVSSGVSTGLLVEKVQPQYPGAAKQARIQGQVVLQAEIDKNGDVEELTLISGHPMLAPAAIEAVKQWKYKPYLLNGQPEKVETQVVVIFQLAGP